MNHKWKLGFLGLVAGILSFLAVRYLSGSGNIENLYSFFDYFYFPGHIFGAATAFYFLIFSRRDWTFWYKVPGWILTSSIAYYVAVQVELRTMDMFSQSGGGWSFLSWLNQRDLAPPPPSMILAGCVGTFILLIGFYFFWSSVTWRQWYALVFLGGLLALGFFVPALIIKPYFTLLIFWQTGITFGFGYILDQKNKISV